jgi:hypothetical protein
MRTAVLILLFASCAPPPSSEGAPPTGGSEGSTESTRPAAPVPEAMRALVDTHNRRRAEHCAPPLAWSAELAQTAQRWAESLRDRGCAFEHSGNELGENLAGGTSGTLDGERVTEMWYREREHFDFRRGGFSMETGHFTQVVWVGTQRIGCGVAECDGLDLWVCNYDPAGNIADAYRENVRRSPCR